MNHSFNPDDFVPVNLLAPPAPLLEDALGYNVPDEYAPRWVAFYWESAGDEARFDDGRHGGDANWHAYLTWIDFPVNAERLRMCCWECHGRGTTNDLENEPCPNCWGTGWTARSLGNSDAEATEWLLLDRETRQTYVVPVVVACEFLRRQWPVSGSPTADLDPEQVKQFYRNVATALNRVMGTIPPPDQAEIEARMRRDWELQQQLVAWLKDEADRSFGAKPCRENDR